ncbi:universal stress protein [Paraburkholderia sp. EG286A]|uniref:universal stress protein n=1 Tax=Paraburkholderia sp. EG286A TaxID=3237014 RepID=UPI0034D2202C
MNREEQQHSVQMRGPLRRIMIAVDDSKASTQALRFASRVVPRDAQVRIVCAAEQPDAWNAGGAYTAGDAWMTGALNAARDWQADMLVVGTRHQGRMKRWVDGSVSGALAVCAPCPLLVVPVEYEETNGHAPLARILLATDGSPASAQAIDAALRLAEPQATLRAVYVVDRSSVAGDPVPGSVLEDALADLGRKALASAHTQLDVSGRAYETALVATGRMRDDVAHTVLRDARDWQADLVALGTQGRRGVARWLLGSVAQRAIEITHVPLLLVGPGAA